jgi:thimet oligopeptidase
MTTSPAPPSGLPAFAGPKLLDPPESYRRAGEAIGPWARDRRAALDDPARTPSGPSLLGSVDALLIDLIDLVTQGSLVFSVHPDAATREAARAASEAANRAVSELMVDRSLYDRLRALDLPALPPEGRRAAEKLLLQMRRSGVELEPAAREELRALADEIDRIQNEYMDHLANAPRTVTLEGASALEGLPEDYVRQHPPGADGKITLTTSYPDAFPVLTFARDPKVRRAMLEAFVARAYPENVEVLDRLLARRRRYAERLGYPDYATYAIEDKMMASPKAAWAFLERLDALLQSPARRDLALLTERKRAESGERAELLPEDVAGGVVTGFYEDRLRAERFGVDAKAVRAYFPYAAVRDGLFRLCEELFGARIRPAPEAPKWDPLVEAYDVERDGKQLGRFYLDMVPREGKFNHAAQFDLRVGVEGRRLPEAVLVCNFVRSTVDPASSLMAYSDVVTFFHESGHLWHALFAGHTPYLLTSNAWIETDFAEAPSIFFEEWARRPELLGRFARHVETGEPIPPATAERLVRASAFARPLHWTSQVAYSAASLALYEVDPARERPAEIMGRMMARYNLLPRPPGDHMECGWMHLTGYSALYYTYSWSLVIARDLLSVFEPGGTLLDPPLAQRYAKEILAPGGSRPPGELVRSFLGRPMQFEAFERWMSRSP